MIGNPYIITTPNQLNRIRNYSGSHFKLGGNIDLTDYLSEAGAGYNSGQYWAPIPSFSGTLDGDGYVVKGLKVYSNAGYIGLFGSLTSGSSIKNIGLEYVEVIGNGMFAGGLAGAIYGPATVSNSYVTGNVTGMYTGGLIGYLDKSDIRNSYSTAHATSTSNNVGGLIGISYKGTITNNYAAGGITGFYPAGGLVGGIYDGDGASLFVDNYYDKEVSRDYNNSGKGIPKSTTEMKTASTFSTWDFDSEWIIKEGHYPELQVFLAETPTADIEGGSVVWNSEIELSSGTIGAAIYYTTNGDEPTLNSTLYHSPIVVTDDMTIKAIAVKGTVYNEAMVESYTVTGRAAAPTTGSLVPGTNVDTTQLHGVTDAMEYKVNNGSYVAVAAGAASVDNISVQVGNTISIRTAAGSGYPATDAQVLTVGQADIHPKSTVSTLISTIGTVSIGGTANETIKDIPYVTTLAAFKDAITPAAYATFEVYEANGITKATSLETGNKVIVTAQNPTMKTTYAVTMQQGRPAGYLSQGTNADTTSLKGVTDVMEYKVNNGNYVAVTTGATIVDNISVQDEDTITVRTAATLDHMASVEQVLLVGLSDIKPKSTESTLTSTIGTVSTGDTENETITSIPYGTTLAAFKAAITPVAHATFEVYEANGIDQATTLATGNKVIVTAQDATTVTTYTVTVQAGPPAGILAPGTNVDTTRLSNVMDVMEYKVNNGNYIAVAMGATFVDNIGVEEGDTISVRTAATLNHMESFAQLLTVGLADIHPKSTASTLTSTIGTVSTGATGNETITNIPYGTTLAAFKAAITPAVYATFEVYEANGIDQAATLATGSKVIVTAQDEITKTIYTITVQIGPPAGQLTPGTNVDTTRLNEVTDVMEYKVNNGNYIAVATGATFVDNIGVEEGDTITVRTAATLDHMASVEQAVIVGLADIKPRSTASTLTSTIGTVSTGATGNETITNIPYGTTLAAFKAAITPAAHATFEVYEANGVERATTLATGNKVIVTAQNATTATTYTVTVEAAPLVPTPTAPTTPTTPTTPTGPTLTPTPTPTLSPTPVVNKPIYNDKVDKKAVAEIKLKAELASSTTFADVKMNSWSYDDIDFATRAGIVKGYANGTFRGEAKVTRGEFAQMLVKALGFTATGTQVVTDATGHFAENAIRALLEKGIMTGYADGSFEPNRVITRAEIAALLARVLDLAQLDTNAKFEDINGSWAKDQINALGNAGIIKGKTEHEFIPNANASREESVVLIVRLLKLVSTE
ncbi:S-layer homology domain-containing protein [Paenibacillus luteus]|uniref:S-layer homology domain-containing protein n=1 Tax=Paenibacillus luteus TaxID=2545753 RepID=UPI001375E4A5|nr:S-layer homology domain-containing protein [Paenibacillus luteus]